MSNQADTQTDIILTDKAVKQIKRLKEDNNIPKEYGVRVGVKGGGCSGMMYEMGFDGETKNGDTVVEKDGVKLYVDGKSIFYLLGTTLDFSDGLNGKGFVFENPNANKTCGCGESFGV